MKPPGSREPGQGVAWLQEARPLRLIGSPASLKRRVRPWRILVEVSRPADEQMPYDEQLANEPTAGPTVRFFLWNHAAVSLGWRQPIPGWIRTLCAREHGPALVERPTGGGAVLHGSDVSLSVVMPKRPGLRPERLLSSVCRSAEPLCRFYGLEVRWTASAAAAGSRITYCLTEPGPYALLIGHRKVGGFALRRYRQSWLIQGSLLVRPLSLQLTQHMPADVLADFARMATSLSEAAGAWISEERLARRWARSWLSWWSTDAATTGLPDLEPHGGADPRTVPAGPQTDGTAREEDPAEEQAASWVSLDCAAGGSEGGTPGFPAKVAHALRHV